MVIKLNSPINTLNKSYANKTSFKKAPTYQNFAEIVRHGSLKEIQNISWIHGCDEQGRNLLHVAAATARTEVINYLSDIINPNLADKEGIPPLHIAITTGNFAATKLLIDKKANINKPDEFGDTPLHKAVNSIDIFKYLLESGANPNVRNNFGIAPLHICYHESQFIDLLKQHNANLNIKDSIGRTILHDAVQEGNNCQIEQFIKAGLDVNATDNYNQSPAFLTKNLDTLKLLIKNGANPNIQDIQGDSILHKVAKSKNHELYNFLLKHGANKYLKNAKEICAFEYIEEKADPISDFGFRKVVGMDELKQTLREMVIEPITEKEEYDKYGIPQANGILLHGLPGCGKTFIAKALAEECGRNFYKISPADLNNGYYGMATKKIKEIFETARNNPPSLIFIDEMESIAPKRSHMDNPMAQDNNERVAELLQQMNNLSNSNIFVIGATNNPEMIDDAVKRAGRLDKSVFVPLLDKKGRARMFDAQLSKRPAERDINMELLAQKTENYTATEIQNIVIAAARFAKREGRNITLEDLLKSIKKVRPQNSRADIERYKKKIGLSELPEQKTETDKDKIGGFAKVAGMNELKQVLTNEVIAPLTQVELYKKYGRTPANGILLYGPPGTGKTFISEALAEETGRYIIHLRTSSVGSSYQNETALNIKRVFDEAEYNAPSIIFIDEIEALAPKRTNSGFDAGMDTNRQISELLQQLNNCAERGIFVIAATNEPQLIDDAIRRVGRFDKTIFVPPPDFEARMEMFRMGLEKTFADKNINLEKLAQLTEYYTASEIQKVIIQKSIDNAITRKEAVSENDLIKQIQEFKPALTEEIVEKYRNKI